MRRVQFVDILQLFVIINFQIYKNIKHNLQRQTWTVAQMREIYINQPADASVCVCNVFVCVMFNLF